MRFACGQPFLAPHGACHLRSHCCDLKIVQDIPADFQPREEERPNLQMGHAEFLRQMLLILEKIQLCPRRVLVQDEDSQAVRVEMRQDKVKA